eukprot:1156182-Pelagomonas_calceolata.AAC.6
MPAAPYTNPVHTSTRLPTHLGCEGLQPLPLRCVIAGGQQHLLRARTDGCMGQYVCGAPRDDRLQTPTRSARHMTSVREACCTCVCVRGCVGEQHMTSVRVACCTRMRERLHGAAACGTARENACTDIGGSKVTRRPWFACSTSHPCCTHTCRRLAARGT